MEDFKFEGNCPSYSWHNCLIFSHIWQKYAYFYSTHALQCPAVKVYRTCAEAGLLNLSVNKLHTIKDLELKTSDKLCTTERAQEGKISSTLGFEQQVTQCL